MKTISELNNKIWYRFLKVAYVIFFIPIFFVAIIWGYYPNESKFDNKNSYIKCDDGREFRLGEKNIYLSGPYVYSWEKLPIKRLCLSGDYKNNLTGEILTAQKYVDKFGLDSIEDNFVIVPAYTKVNWFFVVGISLLSLIGVYLIFQLVKRIFYYIILGSFLPKI